MDQARAERVVVGEQVTMITRRAALALGGLAGASAVVSSAGVSLASGAVRQPKDDEAPPLMVAFVLRHCETLGSAGDPPLSPPGRDRAARIGLMLRSVGAQRVLHTQTARSRETAADVARVLRVAAGSYDMLDPEPVTRRMVDGGGVWVIVGHSNTVPDLVKRLGGDTGTDLIPEAVYDRIYMVVRAAGGAMTVPLHSS